ncbi:DUF5689 domain-containing protein [Fibrella arboris]|uniref:DUF5689 domain-containing protein n=1 Tax=Fibrella arboris TaxID=3242486 RepID=UPI003520633E
MRQPLRFFWLLFVGAFFFCVSSTRAQISISTTGSSITTDFNTLPTTGAPTFTQNGTITGVYGERTGNGTTIVADAGSGTAGSLYSYGLANDTDRAIGSVGSSNAAAGNFAYGIRYKNTTSTVITALQVSFNGEQWRSGGPTSAAQTVSFSYLISSSAITTISPSSASPAGYVAVSALDFTSPVSNTTVGALNGNLSANRSARTATFAVTLNPGDEIMLRWYDPDHSGTDHGMAIDDVSIIANPPVAFLGASPSSLSGFQTVLGTASTAKTYALTGSNLTADVLITAPAGFSISVGGGAYGPTATVTPSAGSVNATVSVQMVGAGVGAASGNIAIVSGTASLNVPVSGYVFGTSTSSGPCGNSVSILDSRNAPLGTSVTITGRLTVSGQFANGRNYYIQDETGGIAIFDSPDNRAIDYSIGDLIQVTGTTSAFNLDKQVQTLTCFSRVGTDNVLPVPIPIALADLCTYQGQLVSIADVSFSATTGTTFQGSTNYGLTGVTGKEVRIYNTTNLVGALRPTGTTSVTGVVGVFNSICQLFPRFVDDVAGAVANSGAACGVPTITPDANALDVVIWNVEWLGNPANGPSQSGAGDATQIANVTTVLKNLNADVFMLEEVCQYNAADPTDNTTAFGQLVNGLNAQYGAGTYAGECSPAVSGSVPDPNPQRVCIIYKPSVVTKIASKPLLTGANVVGYPTGNASQFYASGRLPFMFTGMVNTSGTSKQVRFIGIHAKSGSDVTSYNRRVYDVKALYDTLQAQYPNDLIIYAGDINDDVDKSIYLTDPTNNVAAISSYKPFLYANPAETDINGTRPNANFVAITKELSDAGCASTVSYADIIDHIIVSNEMAPAYVANSVTRITPAISNYSNTTTDHYPVYAKFNLASALPVQLVHFRATVAGDRVSLAWETASERSASRFVVERSVDAREFSTVGQVAASGHSASRKAYGLTDEQPLTGTSYYRLRTVDVDGTSETSKIVAVTLDETTPAMALLGNPIADNQLQLAVRNMAGASYQLRTLTGQAVRMQLVHLTDRVVKLQVDQPLATGVYLLEGRIRTSRTVLKVVIE